MKGKSPVCELESRKLQHNSNAKSTSNFNFNIHRAFSAFHSPLFHFPIVPFFHLPFAICHLPFAICHLLFAICHLPFAICHLAVALVRELDRQWPIKYKYWHCDWRGNVHEMNSKGFTDTTEESKTHCLRQEQSLKAYGINNIGAEQLSKHSQKPMQIRSQIHLPWSRWSFAIWHRPVPNSKPNSQL